MMTELAHHCRQPYSGNAGLLVTCVVSIERIGKTCIFATAMTLTNSQFTITKVSLEFHVLIGSNGGQHNK